MTGGPKIERRRHRRFDGSEYPLRIGRYRARLKDWSAGGVGVEVREGVDGFAPGQTVELGILNERILAVVVVTGRIQRVEPAERVIGIEFLDGAEGAIAVLEEMLGRG